MKYIIVALIISTIVLAGCFNAENAFKSIPAIEAFLSEHPKATINVVLWSAEDIRLNQDKVTLICGKMLDDKSYYYASVDDEEQKIEAFLDMDTRQPVCIRRVVNSGEKNDRIYNEDNQNNTNNNSKKQEDNNKTTKIIVDKNESKESNTDENKNDFNNETEDNQTNKTQSDSDNNTTNTTKKDSNEEQNFNYNGLKFEDTFDLDGESVKYDSYDWANQQVRFIIKERGRSFTVRNSNFMLVINEKNYPGSIKEDYSIAFYKDLNEKITFTLNDMEVTYEVYDRANQQVIFMINGRPRSFTVRNSGFDLVVGDKTYKWSIKDDGSISIEN